MSYVDAGYAVGLSVLCIYSVALVLRRRGLERRVDLAPPNDAAGGAEPGTSAAP